MSRQPCSLHMLSKVKKLILLATTDEGSGVRQSYYSFDGSQYMPYTGTISVNSTQTVVYAFAEDKAGNRSSLITQNLSDSATSASIQLDVNSLSYRAIAGSANPSAQSITVNSTGDAAINWMANASTSWIQLSSATGTTSASLNVSVNIGGLGPGIYTGEITVVSDVATDPAQTVEISLLVADPGGNSDAIL